MIVSHDRKDDQVLPHRQRAAHVDDPRDQERQADEHQHATHDHPWDEPDDGGAEDDGRERNECGHEPGTPPVDVHLLRERRQAERVVPGDPAEEARDDVHQPRVAERLVRVEIGVEQELDAAHVEQARHHGDEHRRDDPDSLVEHRRPVGATERADGPELPESRGGERSQQPQSISRRLER